MQSTPSRLVSQTIDYNHTNQRCSSRSGRVSSVDMEISQRSEMFCEQNKAKCESRELTELWHKAQIRTWSCKHLYTQITSLFVALLENLCWVQLCVCKALQNGGGCVLGMYVAVYTKSGKTCLLPFGFILWTFLYCAHLCSIREPLTFRNNFSWDNVNFLLSFSLPMRTVPPPPHQWRTQTNSWKGKNEG